MNEYLIGKSNVSPDEHKALLIRALAEEYHAWYNYNLIGQFVMCPGGISIRKKFQEIANDELEDHAKALLERINQLGFNPDELLDIRNIPKYEGILLEIPSSFDYSLCQTLSLFIKMEQCSIDTYCLIMKVSEQSEDKVTYDLAKRILADEEEHLSDLIDIRDDVFGSSKTSTEQLLKACAFTPNKENYEPSIQMSDARVLSKFIPQNRYGVGLDLAKVFHILDSKKKTYFLGDSKKLRDTILGKYSSAKFTKVNENLLKVEI